MWAEGEFDGEPCSPRASVEAMRFPVRRWADVAGRAVEWAWGHGPEAGTPGGGFYLDEHTSIRRGRLRFAERDGTAFRFELEGVCDLYRDERRGGDVPFSAGGWARFTGVTVHESGADTEGSLLGRLAQNLDPRDFVRGPLIRRTHRRNFFRRVNLAGAVFAPSDARAV